MEPKLDLLDNPLRARLWARKYLLSSCFGAWVRFRSAREDKIKSAVDKFKLSCALRTLHLAYEKSLCLKHSLSFAAKYYRKRIEQGVFIVFQNILNRSRHLCSAQMHLKLSKYRRAFKALRLEVHFSRALSSAIRCRVLKAFNIFRKRTLHLRMKAKYHKILLSQNLFILRKCFGNSRIFKSDILFLIIAYH